MYSGLSRVFSIKYGALACLVLQNTFLVVYMHYSRVKASSDNLYASSTAVVSMEVIKFVTCIGVIAYERGGLPGLFEGLNNEILNQPVELAKLAVPSILYSVQNNLLYYALSHLDAATFQVGYQLKILTTAGFSYLMLNRYQSRMQMLSLVLLTMGVSCAQLSTAKSSNEHSNSFLGLLAVIAAAVTSGFAGVYFEKLLKNAGTSLWMRNVQMGISSIAAGFLGVYFSGELPVVREKGFFFGYNNVVIFVILLQAIGGLIVAVVVKYADNILKGFAASFSIVTACLLSYFLFDFRPSLLFIVGAALVIISMYLYSEYPLGKVEDKPKVSAQSMGKGSSDSV